MVAHRQDSPDFEPIRNEAPNQRDTYKVRASIQKDRAD